MLTGTSDRSDNQIGQILIDNNVDKAQFFANAATTDTWGLDVVLANVSTIDAGRLTTALAANFNRLLLVGDAKTTDRLAGKEEIFFGLRSA